MAGLTVRGEGRGDVVGIGGVLKIPGVAGVALSGKTLELARGRARVASLAVDCGMRADQREAILVVLDGLYGDVPALHRVTLLAIRAHLPPVNVCVAVGALGAHVAE